MTPAQKDPESVRLWPATGPLFEGTSGNPVRLEPDRLSCRRNVSATGARHGDRTRGIREREHRRGRSILGHGRSSTRMGPLRAIVATLLLTAIASAREHVSVSIRDGGLVHADLYGRGDRTVGLAHGGRFDKESWRKQAGELQRAGLRVLAIDFRGYGQSRTRARTTRSAPRGISTSSPPSEVPGGPRQVARVGIITAPAAGGVAERVGHRASGRGAGQDPAAGEGRPLDAMRDHGVESLGRDEQRP